jgi:hypothetical protein
MASGRSTKIIGATGEYLVAAELSRRGLIATTFTGNVPDYDIVATDTEFRTVLVQVKAISGSSWQFDFRRFADVALEGKRQIFQRPVKLKREIVCVMVALQEYGTDRFYILRWTDLQKAIIKRHCEFLNKHDGIRPKKFDSFHCAIDESALAKFRDNWNLVFEALTE